MEEARPWGRQPARFEDDEMGSAAAATTAPDAGAGMGGTHSNAAKHSRSNHKSKHSSTAGESVEKNAAR